VALDDAHLKYAKSRHGMDHDRYAWSMLQQRQPVVWPGGATLALWINVSLQHFPLNPRGVPVKLPGAMSMPYPDLRHYTLRDYGNRVGIYRVLDALDHAGLKASFAINACLAEQHPQLMRTVLARDEEVLAHSWSMDTPHAGGLAEAVEAALVSRTMQVWHDMGLRPRGWLSPGKLQSPNTPELLRQHGIDYQCDWVNDELPYRFHTAVGDLWSLPLSTELEDRFVIMDNLHAESEWADQVTDAFDLLLAESRAEGGRMLSLSLHPWVIGQPHRMRHLERVLAHLSSRAGVWNAMPGAIVDAFAAASASASAAAVGAHRA
jgi:peptidoglycan/xylan/chitin deacetylase (PgdA/CDA1 family)